MKELPKEIKLDMLKKMLLIRAFENEAEKLYMRGLVHGTMHLSVGEEAVSVGAIYALGKEDYITSTHRGHGHMIAKGGDINRMFAEFLGKDTGYCHGRGGSMHIADTKLGNLGATGIVGTGIPIATGAALALKRRREKKVVLSFFGDGAANEGMFFESLNMAAIWKLPVIYLCENNMYAMSSPVKKFVPTENIADRACAFNIPGIVVDGMDIEAVYNAVKEARERAINGKGPTLIEAKTYRYKGHSRSDKNLYRTQEEIEEWKRKDPIARFKKYLKEVEGISEKEIKKIEEEVKTIIKDGVEFAIKSPSPSLETITNYVYAEGNE